MKPESQMMSHGYNPKFSEGAVKPPIFMTSTFAFSSAEEGKNYFEVAYGLKESDNPKDLGLIYSRMNNPNLEILEDRLCLWDKTDGCAVFESGMSAISTVFLGFLKPGDLLLYSMPTYGGTEHLIKTYLKETGIESIGFLPHHSKEEIIEMVASSPMAGKLKLIYAETPANPTNDLIDIAACRGIARHFSHPGEEPIKVVTDNTYMGPLWSHPLEHGADLIIYSATKYIGGHSDLIAGAVLGEKSLVNRVKTLRTFLGNMASPHTCWLLLRSLETLKVRMEQQCLNAGHIARFLDTHPRVQKVYYLGNLEPSSRNYHIYKKQYSSPGAMISFEIPGGEKEVFKVLNRLKLIKLAVSLGSTESLIQHPASMTHAAQSRELKEKIGITEGLIRLSVGVENHEDIINDLYMALK